MREALEEERVLILSPVFLNRQDDLWQNALKIKSIAGYQDVVCHASEYGFGFMDGYGALMNVSVLEFANILKECPTYKRDTPIRLIACNAGKGLAVAAQYLANYMGVKVLAATDVVLVYPDGEVIIGRNNDGVWRIFYPQEV
jgi:hypothetical protein